MRTFLFLMLISLLAGCSATITTTPLEPTPCAAEDIVSAPQWYNQGKTYRLRHGGALQMGGKTIPITGFMVLDTKNGTANVALLTGLGIKLITLEVSKDSYRVLGSSPVAEGIPQFIEQCALTIQGMFLTSFPKGNETCVATGDTSILTGKNEHETTIQSIDHRTGFMTGKSFESNEEKWSVTYKGLVMVDTATLPEKIIFTSQNRGYTVTLQLNAAEIQ